MENIAYPDLKWSSLQKIVFRFGFIFILLFIIINNNGAYPFWDLIMEAPNSLLEVFIPWVGKHLLHLPYDITIFPNGSSDTTYAYVVLFTIFMVAVVGALIWSVVDRKTKHYTTLYYWLTAAVRFYVGLMLIHYGLVKVIKLQFSAPGLYKLTQPYGDSSPMGLAWTFLGFSKGYNLFMGLAELGAVFLLFRRTLTFGVILTVMATLNVMAVNYCYDIPAKIICTALFVFTVFLLLKDGRRLYQFFFTGNAVSLPVVDPPAIKKKGWRIAKQILKCFLLGYALAYGTIVTWNNQRLYGDEAPKPKLYGLYNIDLFVVNNDTLPSSQADSVRWNQIVIEGDGYAFIRCIGDSSVVLLTDLDTTQKTISFTRKRDTVWKGIFHYTEPNSNSFNLKGTMGSDSVLMLTTRKVSDTKDFRLIKRGFHWINERPYNK